MPTPTDSTASSTPPSPHDSSAQECSSIAENCQARPIQISVASPQSQGDPSLQRLVIEHVFSVPFVLTAVGTVLLVAWRRAFYRLLLALIERIETGDHLSVGPLSIERSQSDFPIYQVYLEDEWNSYGVDKE